MDNDFPDLQQPSNASASDEDGALLDAKQSAITWWIVVFVCVFQTLHSVPQRAIQWLLRFLYGLFLVLGQYSQKIARIAISFPGTLFKRNEYLKNLLPVTDICRKVVCQKCHCLYRFEDCLVKCGSVTSVQFCSDCQVQGKRIPLLRQVISNKGVKRFYPYLVYPVASLVSLLQACFVRPGFLDLCEEWRIRFNLESPNLNDVFDGNILKEFLTVNHEPFLSEKNTLGLMMNIDWFRPFKHRTYSVGAIYMVIINLPCAIRFKRENVLVIGLLPGPSEPPKTINTYLAPVVSELLDLWAEVSFKTANKCSVFVRCALLCVGCDLPAGKKVCGFLSYVANLGCSRCYKNFGTGVFEEHNYSGFDRVNWTYRTKEKHIADVDLTLK